MINNVLKRKRQVRKDYDRELGPGQGSRVRLNSCKSETRASVASGARLRRGSFPQSLIGALSVPLLN